MTNSKDLKEEFFKIFPHDLDIWKYLQPGNPRSTTVRSNMNEIWNFIESVLAQERARVVDKNQLIVCQDEYCKITYVEGLTHYVNNPLCMYHKTLKSKSESEGE